MGGIGLIGEALALQVLRPVFRFFGRRSTDVISSDLSMPAVRRDFF